MYPALSSVQFEIVTCPKDSPLRIEYAKNAAKSGSEVLPMLTKPEFVRLVEDLIGYNQKESERCRQHYLIGVSQRVIH